MGLILLVASIVCVNLNKFNKKFKLTNIMCFNIFNFFKDCVDFVFLRKQNLTDQELLIVY